MLIKQNQLVINGTTLEQSDLQAIANVASDVQAQIDTKAPINNAQFTGNVGIGETSPDRPLHITSADNAPLKIDSSDGGQACIAYALNGADIWYAGVDLNADGGEDFFIYDASSGGGNRLIINSSGNVGIGYASPNEKLHVNGHIEASAGYKLASHPVLDYTSFDGGYSTRLGSTGTSTLNATQIFAGGSVQATFKGGNVGIGTSSPDAKLHLFSNGNVQVRLTAEGSNDPSIFLTGESSGGYTNEGFKIRYDNNVGNTYFDNILDHESNSKMIFRTRASGTPTENVVMQADGGTHFGGPLRLYNSTTDPSNPEIGDTYYNTSDNQVYTWTGNAWDPLSNKFSASGGTENTYNNYKSHTFTSSGTFTADNVGTIEYMIVAGGGGGGSLGGGGGAGGCIIGSTTVNPGNYTITVGGGGGNGGPGSTGSTGGNSSAIGITALGGGGGGSHQGGGTSTSATSGGSGGGGSDNSGNYGRGTGTSGQGNNGGQGTNVFSDSLRGGGGGGGKGQAGKDFNVLVNGNYGNGGDGIQNDYINGTSYWFAGGGGKSAYGDTNNHAGDGGQGGGGGGSSTNGTGGNGGSGGVGYNNGGNGTTQISTSPGGSGGASTGGGAGANAWSASGGAAGGGGIVVIRYST